MDGIYTIILTKINCSNGYYLESSLVLDSIYKVIDAYCPRVEPVEQCMDCSIPFSDSPFSRGDLCSTLKHLQLHPCGCFFLLDDLDELVYVWVSFPNHFLYP